jgi:drug/metabolite transporter (DMT)-like permease
LRAPGPALVTATFILLTLIWGTTWAAIRVGLEGIPPFAGVALRFGIACALLLVLGRLLRVRFGRQPHEVTLWLVNTALAFCVSYGVVYWAEQWVPSGLTAVLFATFPLFVALMAHFTLPAERLVPASLVGVVLGFGGVAVIFSEDFALLGGSQVALASTVMLASPVAAAIASVAVKRLGKGVHPFSLTAIPMGLTAVIMGAVSLAIERDRHFSFDRTSVAALLYLAIFGSAVTFTLYYWLLSHISATRVSLIAYLVPLVAVGVGAGLMDEPLTLRTLTGTILVIGGVALTVRSGGRRRRRREHTAA